MTPKSKRTRTSLQFMGLLKTALEAAEDQGPAPLSYRLPVAPPGGGLPITHTVHLSPNCDGSVLVTCRELPEVTVLGPSEEDALTLAEQATAEALGTRRSSPEFPY